MTAMMLIAVRRTAVLLMQALVLCTVQAMPVDASAPFSATGRPDSVSCPMRSAAFGYTSVSDPGSHDHAAHGGAGHACAGPARHDAPPAQENDCRCDLYSMSRCFSFSPPALLSVGEAFTRSPQRALHEPYSDTPVTAPYADDLFRPPRRAPA
jgi:hypothetical protein